MDLLNAILFALTSEPVGALLLGIGGCVVAVVVAVRHWSQGEVSPKGYNGKKTLDMFDDPTDEYSNDGEDAMTPSVAPASKKFGTTGILAGGVLAGMSITPHDAWASSSEPHPSHEVSDDGFAFDDPPSASNSFLGDFLSSGSFWDDSSSNSSFDSSMNDDW